MLEKISELIIEQLHLSEGTVITEDTNFMNDLRADSFELMELVMALEEEYGVTIDDSMCACTSMKPGTAVLPCASYSLSAA